MYISIYLCARASERDATMRSCSLRCHQKEEWWYEVVSRRDDATRRSNSWMCALSASIASLHMHCWLVAVGSVAICTNVFMYIIVLICALSRSHHPFDAYRFDVCNSHIILSFVRKRSVLRCSVVHIRSDRYGRAYLPMMTEYSDSSEVDPMCLSNDWN